MPLTLEQKKAVVSEVSEAARQAHSAIAAEYRGLNVAQMTRLRDQARNAGVYLKVVPNRLAARALAETQFECMREHLRGPLVLALAQEEPGASARVVQDFAKQHPKLTVRLVAFGGNLLEPSEIDRLAKLPTREEAIARLMAVMQAPIAKLVRTLAEPHAKLVRTLAAVRDQKQGGASAG